ncbi:hypothetical protein [Aquimarina sp. AU474]|uniref:hypothetical protein n=1 Tax=Aquimarina sp. AU474 TaxID=2108529 RepID=UPI000D68BD18|nr:hypothetical protein [Aquimarina sp. AU474]
MKLLLATMLFCVTFGNAKSLSTEPTNSKEKNATEKKKDGGEGTFENKNVHSVKKWKINIEYTNGSVISKTIVVDKDSDLSALETAFMEAEKHLKDVKNIKDYSISPVTSAYVLLAEN